MPDLPDIMVYAESLAAKVRNDVLQRVRVASPFLFVSGRAALDAMDPGGIDIMHCTAAKFAAQLAAENHTLKRSLTNPQLFSGIGNAYSDEILHRACMSPVTLTRSLDATAARRSRCNARRDERVDRAAARAATRHAGWPPKVTAFHPRMAVLGRFGQLCPACGSKVQRIVHANSETNYCARCQTGGKLLADRALRSCYTTAGRSTSTIWSDHAIEGQITATT